MDQNSVPGSSALPSFACGMCGKCFSDADQCRLHIQSHTGQQPFRCIICWPLFYDMSSNMPPPGPAPAVVQQSVSATPSSAEPKRSSGKTSEQQASLEKTAGTAEGNAPLPSVCRHGVQPSPPFDSSPTAGNEASQTSHVGKTQCGTIVGKEHRETCVPTASENTVANADRDRQGTSHLEQQCPVTLDSSTGSTVGVSNDVLEGSAGASKAHAHTYSVAQTEAAPLRAEESGSDCLRPSLSVTSHTASDVISIDVLEDEMPMNSPWSSSGGEEATVELSTISDTQQVPMPEKTDRDISFDQTPQTSTSTNSILEEAIPRASLSAYEQRPSSVHKDVEESSLTKGRRKKRKPQKLEGSVPVPQFLAERLRQEAAIYNDHLYSTKPRENITKNRDAQKTVEIQADISESDDSQQGRVSDTSVSEQCPLRVTPPVKTYTRKVHPPEQGDKNDSSCTAADSGTACAEMQKLSPQKAVNKVVQSTQSKAADSSVSESPVNFDGVIRFLKNLRSPPQAAMKTAASSLLPREKSLLASNTVSTTRPDSTTLVARDERIPPDPTAPTGGTNSHIPTTIAQSSTGFVSVERGGKQTLEAPTEERQAHAQKSSAEKSRVGPEKTSSESIKEASQSASSPSSQEKQVCLKVKAILNNKQPLSKGAVVVHGTQRSMPMRNAMVKESVTHTAVRLTGSRISQQENASDPTQPTKQNVVGSQPTASTHPGMSQNSASHGAGHSSRAKIIIVTPNLSQGMSVVATVAGDASTVSVPAGTTHFTAGQESTVTHPTAVSESSRGAPPESSSKELPSASSSVPLASKPRSLLVETGSVPSVPPSSASGSSIIVSATSTSVRTQGVRNTASTMTPVHSSTPEPAVRSLLPTTQASSSAEGNRSPSKVSPSGQLEKAAAGGPTACSKIQQGPVVSVTRIRDSALKVLESDKSINLSTYQNLCEVASPCSSYCSSIEIVSEESGQDFDEKDPTGANLTGSDKTVLSGGESIPESTKDQSRPKRQGWGGPRSAQAEKKIKRQGESRKITSGKGQSLQDLESVKVNKTSSPNSLLAAHSTKYGKYRQKSPRKRKRPRISADKNLVVFPESELALQALFTPGHKLRRRNNDEDDYPQYGSGVQHSGQMAATEKERLGHTQTRDPAAADTSSDQLDLPQSFSGENQINNSSLASFCQTLDLMPKSPVGPSPHTEDAHGESQEVLQTTSGTSSKPVTNAEMRAPNGTHCSRASEISEIPKKILSPLIFTPSVAESVKRAERKRKAVMHMYPSPDLETTTAKIAESMAGNVLSEVPATEPNCPVLAVKGDLNGSGTLTGSKKNLYTADSKGIRPRRFSYGKIVQFICDKCGVKFKKHSNYLLHKQSQCKDRFHCKVCGSSFGRRESLKVHSRLHTGEAAMDCPVCGKTLSSPHSLRIHMRIHNDEKPYSCPLCPKTFRQHPALASHYRTHTKDRPFKCDICDKCYRFRKSLQDHKFTHTGERRFVCHICSASFFQVSALRVHLRVHAGERPHACHLCGMRFVQKAHLDKHMRHLHKDKHTVREENEAKAAGKPFKCHSCGRGFTSSFSKRRHKQHFCLGLYPSRDVKEKRYVSEDC